MDFYASNSTFTAVSFKSAVCSCTMTDGGSRHTTANNRISAQCTRNSVSIAPPCTSLERDITFPFTVAELCNNVISKLAQLSALFCRAMARTPVKAPHWLHLALLGTILMLKTADTAAQTCVARADELGSAHTAHPETSDATWTGYDGRCSDVSECGGPDVKIQKTALQCLSGEMECCIVTASQGTGAVTCSDTCEPATPGGTTASSVKALGASSILQSVLTAITIAGAILVAALL
jgi:hypothetical protein